MSRPSSDIAFSPSVKRVQEERGSRAAYARVERGFATEVDERLRAFLARAETGFLATASAEGQPYIQHRGGPPGFIRALDDRTLAFADLAGNRQYVSTGNLAENDRVCLILVDYARARYAKKRGGSAVLVSLQAAAAESSDPQIADIIAIDEALGRLAVRDPDQVRIIELRFFAGLSVEETAHVLARSPRTVKREWRLAKAWLYRELRT